MRSHATWQVGRPSGSNNSLLYDGFHTARRTGLICEEDQRTFLQSLLLMSLVLQRSPWHDPISATDARFSQRHTRVWTYWIHSLFHAHSYIQYVLYFQMHLFNVHQVIQSFSNDYSLVVIHQRRPSKNWHFGHTPPLVQGHLLPPHGRGGGVGVGLQNRFPKRQKNRFWTSDWWPTPHPHTRSPILALLPPPFFRPDVFDGWPLI